ncbi:hypothetical protein EDB83DRAFT_2397594, partial [Lactarius deliciosus]
MYHLSSWSCTPQLVFFFIFFSLHSSRGTRTFRAFSNFFCIYFRTKYMHRRESLYAPSLRYTCFALQDQACVCCSVLRRRSSNTRIL